MKRIATNNTRRYMSVIRIVMFTKRTSEHKSISLDRGSILVPRPDWMQIWKKGGSFRKIDEDPKEVPAPCVDVTVIFPCNDSARISTRDSQPELAVEPAVLGLRSAESDAELREGKAELLLCRRRSCCWCALAAFD
jgi:hypothetical protein